MPCIQHIFSGCYYEIVNQTENPAFLSRLENMWQRTVADDDVALLISSTNRNIVPDDKEYFKIMLHIMPQWRLTVPVTVKFLTNLIAQSNNWKIHYATVNATDTKHSLTEFSYPTLGALETGAAAMLL